MAFTSMSGCGNDTDTTKNAANAEPNKSDKQGKVEQGDKPAEKKSNDAALEEGKEQAAATNTTATNEQAAETDKQTAGTDKQQAPETDKPAAETTKPDDKP